MVKKLYLTGIILVVFSILFPPFFSSKPADYYEEKEKAVRLAAEARDIIGDRLFGVDYSPITTTLGYFDAKLLSASPDFPALFVQWLKECGVGKDDVVAVNASGSFPALTLAALSAIEAIDARPVLISSLGASSWGANRPDFTWIHMENLVNKQQPWIKSTAVSLGGEADSGRNITDEGISYLYEALILTDAYFITSANLQEAVDMRVKIWKEHNQGELPNILINIGGNSTFWGEHGFENIAEQGVLIPKNVNDNDDGIRGVFLKNNKTVIHVLGIKNLAAKYDISTKTVNKKSYLWIQSITPVWIRLIFILCVPLSLIFIMKK